MRGSMKQRKNVEDSQRWQLVLYYKQVLKPQYPNLGFVVIKNNGYHDIVTEPSHPDCLWRLKYDEHYYWLFHELKKEKGKLDAEQEIWWDNFTMTLYVNGIITKGLQEHFRGVDNWLAGFYPEHKFKEA